MAYAFRILNVFTVAGDRFSGNPLCVFEDARGMSDAHMQALARQMNLSETTFVLPSERADARVRIFTPGFEMPFAGHPTLGTAFVVAAGRRRIVLEVTAGLVPVVAEGDTFTLRAARPPTTRTPAAATADLASMVGLTADDVAGPPLWVDTGVEQLVIPLRSVEAVRAATPDAGRLARWGYDTTRSEAMAYVWAPDDANGGQLVVRFFFTQHGSVVEDPATGSACANLGGWMIATGRTLPLSATLRQGESIGRPSRLDLHVDADRAIFVSGAVLELGRGSIELD